MQAVIVNQFSEPPTLAELETPEPGDEQILLKVAAAGINPVDVAITQGAFESMIPATFPLILGSDVVAEVVAVGPGQSKFSVGDHVFGQLFVPPLGSAGTFAEYVRVAEDVPLVPLPDGLDPATAAALPTPGGTAQQLADWLADVAGKSVLVVGAGGGVGSYLTQILAKRGAEVIAADSARNSVRLLEYGAATTIDYTAAPLVDAVRQQHPDGIDALVDLANDAEGFASHASQVRTGGAAITTRHAADVEGLEAEGLRAANFELQATAELFARLGKAVVDGELVVPPVTEVRLDVVPSLLAPDAAALAGKTVIRFP